MFKKHVSRLERISKPPVFPHKDFSCQYQDVFRVDRTVEDGVIVRHIRKEKVKLQDMFKDVKPSDFSIDVQIASGSVATLRPVSLRNSFISDDTIDKAVDFLESVPDNVL